MRNTILLNACLLLGTHVPAALPPGQEASLASHLLEVNAQWARQGFAPIDAAVPSAYIDEAHRISSHLKLVRAQLTAHTPATLTTSQRTNRLDLLARLEHYANGLRFPQNHVLPYRNPVFIDPNGTACAVGQLIIESGHRDLAERISTEMNLAYVLEMPSSPLWPEIAAWASEHGFTADELAWIQPAYPPNYPWFPLGGGTNDAVSVLRTLGNGDLLVAGNFTDAGGVAASHVAIWNGNSYEALGAGLEGTVNCAVEFNGSIYLGGAMFNGWSDLARWDGTSWSFSVVFDGKYPVINALHVHNGELYAAGAASGFAGTTEFVQKLSGGTWSPVGTNFDAPVFALGTHNGALVAGGAFTHLNTPSVPPPVLRIATFNGTEWAQLGDGLDGTVRTLLDVDGQLYAGGDFYVNIAVAFGLARIAQGSPYWEHLLPNHPDYIYQGVNPAYISSLVEREGSVYFGGNFSIFLLMTYGSHVGRFDGTVDSVWPLIQLDAPVNAVAITGSQLAIGGEFEAVLPHIGVLDLAAGVNDQPAGSAAVRILPNPVSEELQVLAAAPILSAPILFDASGKQVAVPFRRSGTSLRASVSDLPIGAYVIQVATSDGPVTARFVKE